MIGRTTATAPFVKGLALGAVAVGSLAWAAGIGNPPSVAPAPSCYEDEALVVAPDPDPAHGLTWVCVPLDDFLTPEAEARLGEVLAEG